MKNSIKFGQIILADFKNLYKREGISYGCETLKPIANKFYFLNIWSLLFWGKSNKSIQLLINNIAVVKTYLFLVILEGSLQLLFDKVFTQFIIINLDVFLTESSLHFENYILFVKFYYLFIA
jgi:hypothetical protein